MKYGLLGQTLSQSYSPFIHKQLFGYDYELKELSASELHSYLSERPFAGANVTAPYKEAVLPYLDVVEESAATIGAVNTIVHRNGKLYGYNTDFDGLCALLTYSGISLTDKKVLILGSGGTSKTAMAVARHLGGSSVVRVSRTGKEGCVTYEQAAVAHADAQILINTTPCGIHPHIDENPIDLDLFSSLEAVVDVIYNPLRTKFVCEAVQRGIPAVGGLYMLVAQAAYAGALFCDAVIDQTQIDAVYHRLLTAQENIVLIGMPGCGKTTIGARLAEQLNREWMDTDKLLEVKHGCTIANLIGQLGENGFRDYESALIGEIAVKQSSVISTGGGVVLRPDNILALKENGRMYWLDRDISLLTPTTDRPFSSTDEDLRKRYDERHSLYASACDVRIPATGTVDEIVNLIREEFLNENSGY